MKYSIHGFPFSLLGMSAIGLWGSFQSDFFGLGFIIPVLVTALFIISAFRDFYRMEMYDTSDEEEERPIGKYINTAPFSLMFLAMLSFFGALELIKYGDQFGAWCLIPSAADLILIIMSFGKFHHASVISEYSEEVDI